MIKYALVALLVVMTTLDFDFVQGRFILRATVQGICLLVGLLWWSSRLQSSRLRAYWLPGLYLVVLAAGGLMSSDPLFVTMQVGSLLAVFVVASAYTTHFVERGENVEKPFMHALGIALSIIVIASLIALVRNSSTAYQFATGIPRFQGIYTEPATLSASAGLLIGYALFGVRNRVIQLLMLAAAVICLFEAGSRTYAIAAVVAAIFATWICFRRQRKNVVRYGLPVAIVLGVALLAGDFRAQKIEDYIRADSVGTLTGRTNLWASAIAALPGRLLLGYGFTLGSTGLVGGDGITIATGSQRLLLDSASQTKLHSGYVQAFLDSGILGGGLYLAILGMAAWRLFKCEIAQAYPFLCYAFFFCAVSNIAETMIHSASVFRSVVGWTSAFIALGLIRAPAGVFRWEKPSGAFRRDRSYLTDALQTLR